MPPTDPPAVADDYSQFVPFTARMMAAMRSRESERPDRLFHDPFAATLAGAAAFQRVDQQLSAADQTYVAVRTRFFDDLLADTPVPQVVVLASGLDARAYRLPWQPEVHLYELDYPAVLDYKAQRLASAQPTCHHHPIGADLTQPWADQLLTAGYRADVPTVWLMEGLLMYLSEAQVQTLLQTVTDLSAPGSAIGLDVVDVQALTYGAYQGYFQFGCDQPEALLSTYGWQAAVWQPGDEPANFGRYPASPPPREGPDVGRAFLIRARKTKTV